MGIYPQTGAFVETPNTRNSQKFFKGLPYSNALGMQLLEMSDGHSAMQMPYRTELIGDPDTGVIHGGAVYALMDSCCGAAVMSHPAVSGVAATLDLRLDYMRPATPGQTVLAKAECYHVTRSIAFVRATATDDDTGRPVAAATGAFTIEGMK